MWTPSRPWLILGGCFLASTGSNSFFIAPSSIAPLLAAEFAVSPAAIGAAISATILGGIAVQLPAGVLMDRLDNRLLVYGGVVGFGLVTLALQVDSSFPVFLVLRFCGGLFGALLLVVGANVVAEVFPPAKSGFATGIYIASPPASFAFAHVTSPLVADSFGVRPVFLTEAAVAVVGAAILWLSTTDPISSEASASLPEMARALRNRSVLLVSVSAFSTFAIYVFLNAWVPTYAREVLSLPLAVGGLVTALVPLVGILARPGGGWLSGYLGNLRRPVPVGGLLFGMVLLATIPHSPHLIVFVVLVASAAFAVQLGTGVYFIMTRELANDGTEGTSLTVMNTFGLGGSFVAPILGGWLIATFSWQVAFLAMASLGFLGLVALVLVPEPAE